MVWGGGQPGLVQLGEGGDLHLFTLIRRERVRQRVLVKAGLLQFDCADPAVDHVHKLAVLAEKFGEVARALRKWDGDNLREELIQVAAVAVAWLESCESQPTTSASKQ